MPEDRESGRIDLNKLRADTASGQIESPKESKPPWYKRWLRSLTGSEFVYHPQRLFRRHKDPSLENLRTAAQEITGNPKGKK